MHQAVPFRSHLSLVIMVEPLFFQTFCPSRLSAMLTKLFERTHEYIFPFSNIERGEGFFLTLNSCYDRNSKHLHVFQLNVTRIVAYGNASRTKPERLVCTYCCYWNVLISIKLIWYDTIRYDTIWYDISMKIELFSSPIKPERFVFRKLPVDLCMPRGVV